MTKKPKVQDALERLHYIKRHPHKFERITVPIAICYLKMTVELLLELDSLLITSVYTETFEAVMNYVALSCISELDGIYYSHVRSKLKEELEIRELQIPIKNYEHRDL